jgi:Fe-S cluster assembly protein SufD
LNIDLGEGKQEIEFSPFPDGVTFQKIDGSMLPEIEKRTDDKFTVLNDLYKEGIFIHIPKNKEASLSCKVTSVEGTIISRTVIVLEEGASLKYSEEHHSKGKCFRNDGVFIFAAQNSRVSFENFQGWKHDVKSIGNWYAHLKDDSSVEWLFAQFGGKLSRVKIDSYLEGRGSNAFVKGVFFGDKEQHFDFSTNLFHKEENTSGNILVKGVVDGNSTSVFRGLIKIDKKAQNTNSYLADNSLVLSDGARSYSIPSLEIDANEVKASHGATLGKPDEEEIFYLMARGLRRKEAERLIIQGFFTPVIETARYKEDIEAALNDKVI